MSQSDGPVVVADVGGTNTRVALATGGQVDRATMRRYRNAEFATLDLVLADYLRMTGASPAAACIAMAGPVRNGVGTLTNLDWRVDEGATGRAAGIPRAFVLNDLVAQGHALGRITPGRAVVAGPVAPQGASQLVVGVGTGFNAAPVHEAPGGRIVVPAEAGHVTLPVRTADDLDLIHDLQSVHGFVGVEDVLSGRGVERLDAWVGRRMGRDGHRDAATIMAALEAGEDRATQAGRAFVRILGAVLGDLALSHLPFGGLHLIGGVARAFTPWFEPFGLVHAFRDKGRFGPFMEEFSISVIEDDFAALVGCAAYLGPNPA